MRGVCRVLAAIALTSCTPVSQSTERVRDDIEGIDARALNSCLGVPEVQELGAGRELASYRLSIRRRQGRPQPGWSLATPLRLGATCRYSFVLADRRVRSVQARGHTEDGLSYDGGCLLTLRRCLREPTQQTW